SLPWLDIANGACWIPLVFLFAIRIWMRIRSWQSSAMLGLSLGASWLSGHHEIPILNSYIVLLGSAAIFSYRALRWRRLEFGMLAHAASALTLAALISAVQTVPLYEFGREARRWVGTAVPIAWDEKVPLNVHELYSLPWRSL